MGSYSLCVVTRQADPQGPGAARTTLYKCAIARKHIASPDPT